ncbi:class I SAM-dependent RNA methyltransferase [Lactobacillus sp. LC28-10]|uniref:Class I SAM-dependent RNA methyltransferase n=1 Tax=Secundilactobacillus angelensis TaxID=2722706 RepID=A0ABX1L0C1_9LACO|nr:class I SAM-dependent RNA methyltransferase [Secundilactobacillus angelensis]MCH5461436.1 class I SAM-dependent RNA methyltransferase [Secundilactobacillus angelensis]NLR17751.1 class I SAM-dependent RNA methyltransferase [Secundilactobacillus angelensis]
MAEQKFQLYAATASGLEALAGQELRDLGYEVRVDNGRIYFEGDMHDILRANIWLRTADRIKIILNTFKATTFDDIFDTVTAMPWDQWLPMDAKFPVNGRSKNSKLFSVPDIQAVTKKAIVNQMAGAYHRRTRFPETGALFTLEIALNKDEATLTLDTTGDSLFKRGYRQEKGEAPLKENFAAALIMLTNWHTDMPFVDPMCGSGTLPIEAALMARNIAPGLNRHFSCENWHPDNLKISNELKEEAKTKQNDDVVDITGCDIDGSMIDIAKLNANGADVLHDITFKQVAVKDFKTDKEDGVIIANPPYGKRMGDQKSVRKLYEQMGQVFKPLTTWSKYILTADLEFETFYGQKATKRRKLYNGALRTDYFQYWAQRSHK